jgi:hypothetical protein
LNRLPNGKANARQLVGDYRNLILTPEAAAIVKQKGEPAIAGKGLSERALSRSANATPALPTRPNSKELAGAAKEQLHAKMRTAGVSQRPLVARPASLEKRAARKAAIDGMSRGLKFSRPPQADSGKKRLHDSLLAKHRRMERGPTT